MPVRKCGTGQGREEEGRGVVGFKKGRPYMVYMMEHW